MKGYGWLVLVVAALLLLLPLPAFATPSVAKPPANDLPASGTTAPSTTPTTQTAPTIEGKAVFRVLCGEEVVALTEEDFLIRNLAMEMSPTAHEEALKAQAVAAYTYYARRRQAQTEKADPNLKGADFATPNAKFPFEYTEEKLRERWGEQYDTYYGKLKAAVTAVQSIAITHEGKFIDACYHAISSGSTESAATVWGADVPYLQAVASPGDRLSTGYASEVVLSTEEVRTILLTEASDIALPNDPALWFGTPTLSAAGTVAQQPVGNVTLAGTRVRQLFGLRSAAFAVTYTDGAFTFTVKGYGHGVGMSQHGADYLAHQGYTYEEILHYYYTDVEIGPSK